MEIREIVVPEINSSVDLPQVALPQAPPITLNIGVPVIDMPHFNPMDMEPEAEPPRIVPPKPKPAEPPAAKPPSVKLPKKEEDKSETLPVIPEPTVEMKSLPQRIVEAIPTIPLDQSLQDRCKEAVDTQIAIQKQHLANKRLDFEISRLKHCGELKMKGIRFAKNSPYEKVCRDVLVHRPVPHTHSISVTTSGTSSAHRHSQP